VNARSSGGIKRSSILSKKRETTSKGDVTWNMGTYKILIFFPQQFHVVSYGEKDIVVLSVYCSLIDLFCCSMAVIEVSPGEI